VLDPSDLVYVFHPSELTQRYWELTDRRSLPVADALQLHEIDASLCAPTADRPPELEPRPPDAFPSAGRAIALDDTGYLVAIGLSEPVLLSPPGETVWVAAFSPDGRYLVSASGNTARVWETTTGAEVARMEHDNEVRAVVFSPDGHYVVSGSWDATTRVRETTTGLAGLPVGP
jgi:WD40 repeat protein